MKSNSPNLLTHLIFGFLALLLLAPVAAARQDAPDAGGKEKPKDWDVMLAEGDGRDLVVERCTVCHDARRIRSTYRADDVWMALVDNMISRGAVATPEEAQKIVDYLIAHYGLH